mgnify:CR=1
MCTFENKDGKEILLKMVTAIQTHKEYLGDIDGLIGDGDHGANMNKGFSVFEARLGKEEFSFSEGLQELSMILMNEIGGSMGPIYGMIFMGMADAIEEENAESIDLKTFVNAVEQGLRNLSEIVEARPGDKTLVDTLYRSVVSLKESVVQGESFAEALEKMKTAAEKGRNSTKDMTAKFGRSSRLGERSRGVLDAGACSCCLLLQAMADGITEQLNM